VRDGCDLVIFIARGMGMEATHEEGREVPYPRNLYNNGDGYSLVIFIARGRGRGMEETHEEGREVPYPRYLYNDGDGYSLVIYITSGRGMEESCTRRGERCRTLVIYITSCTDETSLFI
jgi:hypothetical protein